MNEKLTFLVHCVRAFVFCRMPHLNELMPGILMIEGRNKNILYKCCKYINQWLLVQKNNMKRLRIEQSKNVKGLQGKWTTNICTFKHSTEKSSNKSKTIYSYTTTKISEYNASKYK